MAAPPPPSTLCERSQWPPWYVPPKPGHGSQPRGRIGRATYNAGALARKHHLYLRSSSSRKTLVSRKVSDGFAYLLTERRVAPNTTVITLPWDEVKLFTRLFHDAGEPLPEGVAEFFNRLRRQRWVALTGEYELGNHALRDEIEDMLMELVHDGVVSPQDALEFAETL